MVSKVKRPELEARSFKDRQRRAKAAEAARLESLHESGFDLKLVIDLANADAARSDDSATVLVRSARLLRRFYKRGPSPLDTDAQDLGDGAVAAREWLTILLDALATTAHRKEAQERAIVVAVANARQKLRHEFEPEFVRLEASEVRWWFDGFGSFQSRPKWVAGPLKSLVALSLVKLVDGGLDSVPDADRDKAIEVVQRLKRCGDEKCGKILYYTGSGTRRHCDAACFNRVRQRRFRERSRLNA